MLGTLLTEIRRPLDAYRIELATFAAAYELQHSPCSLAHGTKLAKMIGKDALIAITAGRENEVLSPTDVAIFRYARQIARDASQITAADIQALRETHGLSDAEIFDIAANAASRCFFAKLLDGLGVDADRGFMSLEADLREALTVGRPIAEHAPHPSRPAERTDCGANYVIIGPAHTTEGESHEQKSTECGRSGLPGRARRGGGGRPGAGCQTSAVVQGRSLRCRGAAGRKQGADQRGNRTRDRRCLRRVRQGQ